MSQTLTSLKVFWAGRAPWFHWFLLFGWMGLIFFLSHQPNLPHLPSGFFDLLLKKLAHATAYAILMGLWWQALKSIRPVTGPVLILAFILTALYAASDEWHQTFIPHRDGNLIDVLIDTAGAGLMFVLIRFQEHSKDSL